MVCLQTRASVVYKISVQKPEFSEKDFQCKESHESASDSNSITSKLIFIGFKLVDSLCSLFSFLSVFRSLGIAHVVLKV